ncbi:cbb3-type cytochrome oxidase assembly protein CcoS [Litoreibacter roseus]|uniref:Cbb3-type cytochrome oxidase assembly protein CcoS n=1 Tax=Litoreibacter roseus TaxID=2601869 RepID=A0A6N6JHJ3_9RHOB|nr:cbb3-type cytochrome oxidase assembly protein CcoS [Litoreibacter roseus]GFE64849.1 hypothetical protein KIN_19230 [Litoreibacter roseus]
MNILLILVPVSLCLGAVGLIAFVWSLRSDQYEDLDGDAQRILFSDEAEPPDRDQTGRAAKD